jgi:hypothetical protein
VICIKLKGSDIYQYSVLSNYSVFNFLSIIVLLIRLIDFLISFSLDNYINVPESDITDEDLLLIGLILLVGSNWLILFMIELKDYLISWQN